MPPIARAAGLAGILLAAACAAPPPSAEDVTLLSASAVVEAVDPASRSLRLRDVAGGEAFTVTAPPEVRNFAQIAPGDRIDVEFLEATVLDIADPADDGEPATLVAGARAPEGALPGGEALVATSVVVEVVSYDVDTGFATFRLPDGTVRRATLPPSLRSFAAARRPGDRVLVTIADAVAVTITHPGA